MEIRPETPADADAIQQVTRDAFLGAEHTSGTEHLIVRELRRAGALAVSLVAVVEGRVVGHVAASPVTISDGAPGWYGLGPVSVAPSHQGRGLGQALVWQALSRLKEAGACGCVVLGEPAYYGRFGFRAEPLLVLDGVPPAYFQALRFTGTPARGTVRYHPAFDAAT